MKKLHIGCGDHPLDGWTNCDLNPCRSDILRMDATRLFPFPDAEFHYVFSEKMTDTDWRYVAWAQQHFGLKSALDVGVNLAQGFGHRFIYSVFLLREALL